MSSSPLPTAQSGTGPCVLQRLRQETRAEHDAIERTPLLRALFMPGFDVSSYLALLAAQFGFYQPLEARLASCRHFGGARRTSLLARDLAALGLTLDELGSLPRCRQLPDVSNDLGAAGCSYVLEGAALGGQIICRRLLGTLPDHARGATEFYRGRGRGTAEHWREVQGQLQTIAADCPRRMDAMVAAARDTFRTLTAWLAQPTSAFAPHAQQQAQASRVIPLPTTIHTDPSIRPEEVPCHA